MIVTRLVDSDLQDAQHFFETVFPIDLKKGDVEDISLSISPLYKPLWHTFIARDSARKMVGITGIYKNSSDVSDTEVWLSWFGIMPKFRNRGYGSELLRWTMDHALNAGYTHMKIYTYTNCEEACRLYEKHGFRLYREIGSKLFYEKRLVSISHVHNDAVLVAR